MHCKRAKEKQLGDREAPKGAGRMGPEVARKDQLNQQAAQVGKESGS